MLTFIEAAKQVLESKGAPLDVREIWRLIEEQGLCKSEGSSPIATLSTELLRASRGVVTSKSRAVKPFFKAGVASFGLVEWLKPDELAILDIEEQERGAGAESAMQQATAPSRRSNRARASAEERRRPEKARLLIAQLLPDEGQRAACLTLFARVVERIHTYGASKWGVTLHRKKIHLNVGRLLAFGMYPSNLWVALDPSAISKADRKALEASVGKLSSAGFKSAPDVLVCHLPVSALPDAWPLVEKSFWAFISRAAETASQTPWAWTHSPGVLTYVEQVVGRKLPSPAYNPSPTDPRLDEMEELFEEFVESFVEADEGKRHLAAYAQVRESGRANFKQIQADAKAGRDITDAVLLKLLPHVNNDSTRAQGAWIHQAPAIQGNIKQWFEGARWVNAADWPKTARAIFDFVQQVVERPQQLEAEIREFTGLRYTKGLQSGMISPILNALAPEHFLLVNNKSRRVLNYFTGTAHGPKLTDYPAANRRGWALLRDAEPVLDQAERSDLPACDLFDAFAHWLVTIKSFEPLAKAEVVTGIPEDRLEDAELGEALAQPVAERRASLRNDAPPQPHSPEPPSPPVRQPRYTREDLVQEAGLSSAQIEGWERILLRKKQVVLQGPPGTGKTFIARRLGQMLVSESDGLLETVQFHPAYAYEDFIQGIRPSVASGGVTYELVHGRFVEFCLRANRSSARCVLIVDEINRANLPRVFGELMYLLEYRDKELPLAAGGAPFRIPDNVYVIGTMNTADRSIARMDHALRRRFSFIRLRPDYEVLARRLKAQGHAPEPIIETLREVNRLIEDPNYELGISYFMGKDLPQHLPDIWACEIEPYLEEFFYDQPSKVQPFRWAELSAGRFKGWS